MFIYANVNDDWAIMVKGFHDFFINFARVMNAHTFDTSSFSKFTEIWIYKVCSVV